MFSYEFWEIFKNTVFTEHLLATASGYFCSNFGEIQFNKVEGLRLFGLRLQHRCFPMNFGKFLRTPLLHNTSWRLLLVIFVQILGRSKIHVNESVNRQAALEVYLLTTIIFNLNHKMKQIIFPGTSWNLKKRSGYRQNVIKETQLVNPLSSSLTGIVIQLSNILFQFAFKTDYKKYILLPSLINLSQNVFTRRSSYNLSLLPMSFKQLDEIKVSMLKRRKTSNFVSFSHENVGKLHQVRAKHDCIK